MDLLQRLHAIEHTNGSCLIDGEWRLTYADAATRARRVAAFLAARGVAAGDVVAIGVRDEAEIAAILLACLTSGAVPVFVDADATRDEVAQLIATAQPSLWIIEADLRERWDPNDTNSHAVIEYRAEKKKLLSRWIGKKSNADTPPTYPGCLPDTAETWPEYSPAPEDRALLLYTSGTTSGPKLVPLTRRNLAVQVRTMADQLGWDTQSRVLNLMPATHVDGLVTGVLTTLWCGGTMIRLLPFSVPRLPSVLDAVYQHGATHAVMVPSLLSLMLQLAGETAEAFDHPDFCYVVSTAATLADELWQEFEDLTGKPVVNVYGMSEIGNLLFAGPAQDTHRIGTLGAPAGCETLVVDDDGQEVADGETGELLVRGDSVTPGYLSAETPWRTVDGEQWFPTGDLVTRDAGGTIRLVGRKKDLVITAGHNVAPDEVNGALLAHSGVVEAATVGLPDPVWGERLASCVVVDGTGPSPQELRDWVADRLTAFKVPREVRIVADLPKNRSGKVVLAEVRERILAEAPQTDTSALDNVEPRVLDLAATTFRTPRSQLTLASGPDDCLGWDSMAHLEFVLQLEQAFSVSIPPRDVMRIKTLQVAVDVVELRSREPIPPGSSPEAVLPCRRWP